MSSGFITGKLSCLLYTSAQKAGFHVGDEIIRLENKSKKETLTPDSTREIMEFLQYYPGEITYTVLRDGKQVTLQGTAAFHKDENLYILGIGYPQSAAKEISFWEAIPYGTQRMVSSVTSIMDSLGKLVRGVGLNNLSGPVGIFQITAQTTQDGLLSTCLLYTSQNQQKLILLNNHEKEEMKK